MDKKGLGKRLKARREYLNLTQQEVADALSMNRVTYAQYETGRNEMAVTDLPRIAEVLSVPVSYFFDDDNPASGELTYETVEEENERLIVSVHGMPRMTIDKLKRLIDTYLEDEPRRDEGRTFGKRAE